VRSSAALLVLAASTAAALGACGKPKSFIVLDLKSTTQIAGVTEVDVTVEQPPSLSKMLSYPVKGDAGTMLVINSVNTNNLSVSFTGGRSGPVTLGVTVLDSNKCVLGGASGITVPIRQGDIVQVGVGLEAHTGCTKTDGGTVVDGSESDAFPGCDPAAPLCPAGDTCQVNCTTMMGECTPGGTGGSGAPCNSNMDCEPGAQCFDYSGTGCGVKICLRFCNGDDVCQTGGAAAASASDGGAGDAGGAEAGASPSTGTQSACKGLVPCGMTLTPYHTCTFGCDPRAVAAAAETTGCPKGLSCLVVGNMDQVDCACAEASRKGMDGDDCKGGADCAPGFICNMMANSQKCRAICRCNNKDMACTAVNECGGGKSCTALTNETTFGVCL
jgi:hypothetical protein